MIPRNSRSNDPDTNQNDAGSVDLRSVQNREDLDMKYQLKEHASSFDDHLDALTSYCERSTKILVNE